MNLFKTRKKDLSALENQVKTYLKSANQNNPKTLIDQVQTLSKKLFDLIDSKKMINAQRENKNVSDLLNEVVIDKMTLISNENELSLKTQGDKTYFVPLTNMDRLTLHLPSDGIIRVKLNNSYNYINEQNQFISEVFFRSAEDFRNGYGLVFDGSQYYYIEANGKKLRGESFPRAWSFSNGYALVELPNGRFNFLDTKGQFLLKTDAMNASSFNLGLASIADEFVTEYCDTLGHIASDIGRFYYASGFTNHGVRLCQKVQEE